MGYHRFKSAEGDEYGSFEVFYVNCGGGDPGWFWQACFPGCLPDGEPFGPYTTEQEAIDAAQEEV